MALRLLALAFTTILGLGCFVLDELDHSRDLLDNPSFSNQQKKPEAPAPPQEVPQEKAQADRPSEGDWWKKTRTLTSGEVSSEFVKCELGGKTQFMRRPDCLARGGTPRRAGS
jgi:hypothetical protein